jgi:Flp pilus assembly protein TadG
MANTAEQFTRTHRVKVDRASQQGQSMVEFALLLLPFLIVTIGIIEIGRAWSVKQAVTNAAREGARILLIPYGLNQSCPDLDCSSAESVQAAAVNTTRTFLTNAGVSADSPLTQISLIRQKLEPSGTITTEPLTGEINSGDLVGIQIGHQYTSLVQGFISSNSATINLVGTSVMRHE